MKANLLTLALAATLIPAHAATYHAPNTEGIILLKTDQIPLDENTMKWLSKYLTQLAGQQAGEGATELRASAKLLALAGQLDRANPRIAPTEQNLQSGTKAPALEKKEWQHKRLLNLLTYLSDPELSTKEGMLLGQLTKDAIAPLQDTSSPLYSFKAPETLWLNSIQDLDAFAKEEEAILDDSPRVTHSEITPEPVANNKPKQPKPKHTTKKADWKLKTVAISAPLNLYTEDSEGNDHRTKGRAQLRISIKEAKEHFKIYSSPTYRNHDKMGHFQHEVSRTLEQLWGKLPGARINVKLDQAYSSSTDRKVTEAALVTALDAALRGTELRDDFMLVGNIQRDGSITRTPDFWSTLGTMSDSVKDCRILVAKEAEGDLFQLIALKKPEFLIKNEVIAIPDFSHSHKYSGQKDHESIAEASAIFQEVKQAIEHKSLRSMTENKYVRQKLEKILALSPNHLSAKILLEYGARKKPSKLESKYFAYTVKELLSPIDQKARHNYHSLNSEKAYRYCKSINETLEVFEPILDSKDDHIVENLQKLSNKLRAFARARENGNDNNESYFRKAAKKNFSEIKQLNQTIQRDVATLTGVPYRSAENR